MKPLFRKPLQQGASTVEFALVAMLFFTMLLGTIEFGRLIYVWNTVQEVSRNAARQLVVTDFNDAAAISTIKRSAVFRTTDGSLPAAAKISNAAIRVQYLNGAGTAPVLMPTDPGDNIAACLDSTRTDSCIRLVEVSICSGTPCSPVQYVPMINLFPFLALNIPMATVRMPAESLGFRP